MDKEEEVPSNPRGILSSTAARVRSAMSMRSQRRERGGREGGREEEK